jgi:hypothetical protein
MKSVTKPKSNWREKLAALPPERQEQVKEVIKKYIERRQARTLTAAGDTLH